jgi:RimJ/RimL family protein N-acetyltransferase
MLLEKPTPTLRESRAVVLETDRLVLRQPTLADVKAIARVVGDKARVD